MIRFRSASWFIILLLSAGGLTVTGHAQNHPPDVEFVPTPQEVVLEMLKMAAVTKDDVVYDLGSGDGRIVITAAKVFGAHGVGVEVDPQMIRWSTEKALKAGVGNRVTFLSQNLFETDISKATVVTLYLTPDLNLQLRPKFFRDLKPGTRVVSHDFDMDDWKPDNMGWVRNVKYEYPDRTYVRDAPFYYWVIPENVAGVWRWTMSSSTGGRDYTLRLVQKFQEISGEMNVGSKEIPILDARLTGNQLSFTFSADTDREKTVMKFNGRIRGDTLEGSAEGEAGPFKGKHTWAAKRNP